MKFVGHGRLKMWVEDNIAFVEVSGAWNVEKAKEFIYQLNTVIRPQLSPPYSTIGIIHDDWFPTSDAIPYLNKATLLAIQSGMRKEAYVTTSPLSARITEELVLPQNCEQYEKREFDNLPDALAWVKQRAPE